MSLDRIQGNWKQVTGQAKEPWGKLTDDDFVNVAGQRDLLAGKIQKCDGVVLEEAERQVSEAKRKASDDWFSKK